MKLKDATRSFGSVVLLLPVFLIFLIAADASYACPDKTAVAYRTKVIQTRSVPMGSTVITYGGPVSYRRCANNAYGMRTVKYVRLPSSGARYIAVRSSDRLRPMQRTRYIAVRGGDLDDASRYVVVRRQPAYVDTGARYVVVRRSVPRVRYVTVREDDLDETDAPRYVAVRRDPVYDTGARYIAVRNYIPRTRYVAIRDDDFDDDAPRYVAVRNVSNACACDIGLRSSLDQIETRAPRHVVVKSDYLAGTEEVIVPPSSYDDTAYVTPSIERVSGTRYVVDDVDPYFDSDGDTYVSTPPALVNTRMVSYVPVADDDIDDRAILESNGATYLAVGDLEDACLSPVAVQAPMETRMRAVSYVPVENVDDYASLDGSDTTYIAADDSAPILKTEYMPVVTDDDDLDVDTTYVVADENDSCSCPIALRAIDEDVTASTVSYVPVADVDRMETATVSYVPVNEVEDLGDTGVSYVPVAAAETETASYVPVEEMVVEPESHGPAETVEFVEAADIAAAESPAMEIVVEPETAFVADNSADLVMDDSTALVTEVDGDMAATFASTQRIGSEFGYRDGFEAGKDRALRLEEFRPGDSSDFQNGTVGFVETYGDMDVYRNAYRSSYLQGYSAGFNSVVAPGSS
jgi:hypothetical protein